MYFQYSSLVGDHEIRRNVIVDDELLSGSNGFLFKEIISDFSLKQCEELSIEYPTTVLAASNRFISDISKYLQQFSHKKIFIFNEESKILCSNEGIVEYIDNEDIPLSQSEWREKIVITEKTVVIKESKFIAKLARGVSESNLPIRIKNKILSRIPMYIEKLEKEIERDIVFIPFSSVRFIGNTKVSNKLIKKCILCGIRVEGLPLSRSEIQSHTEKAVKKFKEKILQYV